MLETETDFWESIKSERLHIKHFSSFTLLLIRTFSLHDGVLVSRRLLHFRTKVENRMAPQVISIWNLCNNQVSAVPRWLQQTNKWEESWSPKVTCFKVNECWNWKSFHIYTQITKWSYNIALSFRDTKHHNNTQMKVQSWTWFWDSPNAVQWRGSSWVWAPVHKQARS